MHNCEEFRKRDMKGENHQTQVYKSLYFLILIMYPPHVVNYNIQNQTTNLYLQYWMLCMWGCAQKQHPIYTTTEYAEWCNNHFEMCLFCYYHILSHYLFIYYRLVSLLLHVWRLFFHMAVVSYSCHRSYCTLNLLLLFMKLSKLWYHLKQKASFLLYLFLSLSLPLSTKPLSCHLEASSHTNTMCLLLCSKKKILRVEWSMYLKLTQFLQWCLLFQVEWWVAELIFLCLNNWGLKFLQNESSDLPLTRKLRNDCFLNWSNSQNDT